MTISERGWTEIKVSTSMIIVATMAVSLRFLARRLRKVSLGLDDWTAFTALVRTSYLTLNIVILRIDILTEAADVAIRHVSGIAFMCDALEMHEMGGN